MSGLMRDLWTAGDDFWDQLGSVPQDRASTKHNKKLAG